MKEKRIILFGLTFAFLTSTVVVWASSYHEGENIFMENSEIIQKDEKKEDMLTFFECENGSCKESSDDEEKEDIKDSTLKEYETIDIATNSNVKTSESSIAIPNVSEKNFENDFDIEGVVLIKYNGTDEKVTVPDGVEIVGKEAFKGNSHVKELILPDSVKCAESEAFAYMENLEIIEKGAFFYTEYDDIYDGSDKLSQFNVRSEFY